MKKNKQLSLALLLGGLAFTACTEADEHGGADSPADNAIRFSANTAYTSRSADITTNNLDEFKVYAYTGPADSPTTFMNNVTVKKTAANTWTYSPLKYWPNEPVSFYAYAPTTWVGTDGPLKPVAYDAYPAKTDLVYAVSRDISGNANAANAQVILNFRHALSKVTLNLSSTNPDLKVVITNVVMCNLMMKGSFNFPEATTTAGTAESDKASVGTWTDLNTAYNYIFHMAQRPSETITLTTTPTDMSETENGGSKYLIPQTLTWRSHGTGNDTYIVIMCSVYDAETGTKLWPNDNTPPENYIPGSTFKDGLLKFPLSTSTFSAWEPGYHYIYNLVINANPEMGAIDFGTPTVDSYVDVVTDYN